MTLNPDWRTSTVAALARTIREERAYHLLPILSDALQDAGCDEPWVESLRAGLPVAEAAGYLVPDGWWEYAELTAKIDALPPCGHAPGAVYCTQCPEDSPHIQLRRRRSELRDLHTGACPTCADRKNLVLVNDDGNISTGHFIANPCTTCVLGSRERWDRAKCPECRGSGQGEYGPGISSDGIVRSRWNPCPVCGGSGDLLLRIHEYENDHFARLHPQPRPLSFDGPLPLVSARVEEIAEEVECGGCRGDGSLTRFRGPGATNAYRDDCDSCSGTGRIMRPTAWLRSLPVWYEVTIEGVEPRRVSDSLGEGWTISRRSVPGWLWDMLTEGDVKLRMPHYKRWHSPAAARQALIAGLRRFRFNL